MARCPACGVPIASDAWVCPACDHVVRADDVLALDEDTALDDAETALSTRPATLALFDALAALEEPTSDGPIEEPTHDGAIEEPTNDGAIGRVIDGAIGGDAFDDGGAFDDDVVERGGFDDGDVDDGLTAVPEARIIGELDDEPSVATFAGSLTGDGPSTRIVLYAPARSLAVLQPAAIVVRTDVRGRPGSKAEALVLGLVDGVASVAELRGRAPIAEAEVDGVLLVLLDRGLVRLDVRRAAERPPSTLEPVYPTDLTDEDAEEGSAVSDPTPIVARRAPTEVPVRAQSLAHPASLRALTNARPGSIAGPSAPLAPPPLLDPSLLVEVSAPAVAEAPRAEPPRTPTLSERLAELGHGSAPRVRTLLEQAARDLERGDAALAETSLKLALTFEPGRAPIRAALAEVVKLVPKDRPAPARVSARERVLDQVGTREVSGDVDGAIELLERALRTQKDAALYNRLGVLVATKKGDVTRGRELLEKAVELAPNNETYQHNLSKVLTRAATLDLAKRGTSKAGAEGLLGLFKKK